MKVTLLLAFVILTLLPLALSKYNADTVCGRAVRRCRDAPACLSDLRRVMKRCADTSLDCKRCGLAMSSMVENRHGLSVLLCTDHLHRERRRVENFLQQCTNTDRIPPPGFPKF